MRERKKRNKEKERREESGFVRIKDEQAGKKNYVRKDLKRKQAGCSSLGKESEPKDSLLLAAAAAAHPPPSPTCSFLSFAQFCFLWQKMGLK